MFNQTLIIIEDEALAMLGKTLNKLGIPTGALVTEWSQIF